MFLRSQRESNRASSGKEGARVVTVSVYAVLLAAAGFLLFCKLDGRLLWGDEAETATLARNVVRYGFPKTFDGVNRIALWGEGKDANAAQVWTWSPWLQEYVAAGSFMVFGATTWSSRAPFAAIAWVSLLVLGWMTHRIYRDHRVTVAAVALMGTSELFLLQARQCRYYSISVLAEILFLWGAYDLLAGDSRGRWKSAAGLVALFYCNYILAVADLPVLAALVWVLVRRDPRLAGRFGKSLGLVLVAVAPWIWYARIWQQAGALRPEPWLPKLGRYVLEFHFHILPLALLLLPLCGFLVAKRQQSTHEPAFKGAANTGSPVQAANSSSGPVVSWERLLLIMFPSYLLVLLIPPGAFSRYFLPLLPAACVLTAAWVFRYLRRQWLAVGLIVLQCTTNALPLLSAYPFRGAHQWRWPLYAFARGVMAPPADRLSDVLAYLQREAHPGQTLYSCDPEFPLIFYTDLQVIDSRFVQDAQTKGLPDWVLSESASGVMEQSPQPLPEALRPVYQAITVPVHDSSRLGVVPDPDVYEYTAAPLRPFLIYKRQAGVDRTSP